MRTHTWTPFLLVAVSTSALAQGLTPIGSDFQVNTYTTDYQGRPDVAARPDGGFLVVWSGTLPTGLTNPGTGARRFDSLGDPIGDQFQVNSNTLNMQSRSVVAIDQVGRTAAVWSNSGPVGGSSDVVGRLSLADGTFFGPDFLIQELANPLNMYLSDVAANDQSEFIVAWQGLDFITGATAVQARRILANDTLGAEEIEVATAIEKQLNALVGQPGVTMDSSGSFIIVWGEFDMAAPDPARIMGRRYGADDAPIGAEFQVDTDTSAYIFGDFLGTPVNVDSDAAGNFVVVWSSIPAGGGYYSSIRARRFAADGTGLGNEFRVDTNTLSSDSNPDLVVQDDGTFVVVWSGTGSLGNDNDNSSVQARRFEADGDAVGLEVQVNSYTAFHQFLPSITAVSDSDFIVTWSGTVEHDNSNSGVAGRRLGAVVEEPIFADGFESGDTSAWSGAVP